MRRVEDDTGLGTGGVGRGMIRAGILLDRALRTRQPVPFNGHGKKARCAAPT